MDFSFEVAVILAVLSYLLYTLATRKHDYWRKRGVVGPKPKPFFGTQKDLLLSRVAWGDFFKKPYDDYKGEKYVGMLAGPRTILLLRDPDLIKTILTKDFEFFPDRAEALDEEADPVSAHLFNTEGVRWKSLRIKVSSSFTSGKTKHMFQVMTDCSNVLHQVLDNLASQKVAVEMKDVMSRFAVDTIGRCALGVDCNSLADPNSEFYRHGFEFFSNSLMNKLRVLLLMPFPKSFFLHKLLAHRSINKFMFGFLKESKALREKSEVRKGDLVDLLMDMRKKGRIVEHDAGFIQDTLLNVSVPAASDDFKFTDKSMAAIAFGFFCASFETSSSAMSFAILELSHNPGVLRKAQEDVDKAMMKHEGITYESLADMTYLDKVISETLRKYPPASALPRTCRKPYRVPGSELVLEPDTVVVVPLLGLHYDPQHFPDPQRFDPERFSPEAKESRHPFAYLPFGEGPRVCVGKRFGLVQTKLGLAILLSRYDFLPSGRTQYPVSLIKGTFVTASADGCHVHVRRRADTTRSSA